MSTHRLSLIASSTRKLTLLLTLTLMLGGAHAVSAQGNANNANGNTGNANANVNRNDNANTNANVNANRNGNTNDNANGNANGNTNQSGGVTDPKAEERVDNLAKSGWFLLVVTLMFAAVLVPFAWTIVRAVRFSRATFRSPLGLPEGSLRAMLAYTLVAFLGFYVYAAVLSISDFQPPDFLLGIVATVVGFYFGSRTGEDKGAAAGARVGIVQGNVTDKDGAVVAKAKVDLFQSGVKKDTEETDAKGGFRIENVAPGEYEIQASAEGKEPSDRAKVTVKAGATQSVNLKLK